MNVDESSYEAVLADLERRRDEITTAINAIRSLMGLAPDKGDAVGTPPRVGGVSGKLRDDQFFGMSIPQAAKKLLAIMKKPMTAPEIARELRTHGLKTDSPRFAQTVYGALHREQRKKGTVVQSTGKRWGLAEWYPQGARRARGKEDNGDSEPTNGEQTNEPEQPS